MSDHSGLDTVESGQTKNLLRSTKQRSSLFVDMLLPKRVSVHVLIEINVPFCTLQGYNLPSLIRRVTWTARLAAKLHTLE